MIKVILREREIVGDWDTARIVPIRGAGDTTIVAVLELSGKDGKASFNMADVVGWHDVKGTPVEPVKPMPRKEV